MSHDTTNNSHIEVDEDLVKCSGLEDEEEEEEEAEAEAEEAKAEAEEAEAEAEEAEEAEEAVKDGGCQRGMSYGVRNTEQS